LRVAPAKTKSRYGVFSSQAVERTGSEIQNSRKCGQGFGGISSSKEQSEIGPCHQELTGNGRTERMGLNELALPPWTAVMSVEYRADGIEIAFLAPPIVLQPEKHTIILGCDPVHT